ncbi:MAG: thioredoxin family protein [Bacteroidota bacterium]
MRLHCRMITAFLVLLMLTTAMAQEKKSKKMRAPRMGDPLRMTEIKMKNVDGRELSIAEVAGEKGTLIIFSCNSCPWVIAWEDRIVALGNTYQNKGFGVMVINPNDPRVNAEDSYEVMQKRSEERGFAFPYVVDATSDVARAYGATRTPEVFLFDQDGRLVYHGVIDDNAKDPKKIEAHYLRDAMEALIGGKKIPVKETKSLGCTIKFRAEL